MRFRKLVPLIVAFAVLVASEAAVRTIDHRLPDPRAWPTAESELKSRALLQAGGDFEVVFVGTSVSEAAIDPSQLHVTAFNASLPFSTPRSNLIWTEEHVLARVEAELVVVGLLPSTLVSSDDVLVSSLVTLSDDSSKHWWEQSELLRRRRQLRDWDQSVARVLVLESGLWTSLGHQTLYYDRVAPAGPSMRPMDGAVEMDPLMQRATEALFTSIRASGARPVALIEPGGCPDSYERCPDSEQIYRVVRSWLTTVNVDVIDGRSVGWPSEYFADHVHFNRDGTRAFSRFVDRRLAVIAAGGTGHVSALDP